MAISGVLPTYKGGEHSIITEVVSVKTTAALSLAALTAKSGEFNYIDAIIVTFEDLTENKLCQVIEDTGDTRLLLFEFFVHGHAELIFEKPFRQPNAGLNLGVELAAGALDDQVSVIMGHTGT